MSAPIPSDTGPAPKKHRRLAVVTVVVVVIVAGLLAAIFIPYNSQSKEIQVSPGAPASATFTLPAANWVTVHFDHHGAMSMMFWMNGPGGMMFNHRGMMSGDSYSFWSGGGDFQCWAGYDGGGQSRTPVWVNATWGLL